MLNKSVIFAAALLAAGLFSAPADARNHGTKTSLSASAHHRNADMHTGSLKHMKHEPYGWNQGRKRGWHCSMSSKGCMPPGYRKHYRY